MQETDIAGSVQKIGFKLSFSIFQPNPTGSGKVGTSICALRHTATWFLNMTVLHQLSTVEILSLSQIRQDSRSRRNMKCFPH